MASYCSNLTLTNCTFSANVAEYGAGMFNDAGCLTMTKCTFSANSASGGGGGMRNHSSSATMTDCIFIDNSVSSSGAGIYNDESSPILVNCTFSKNLAGWGAGISNRDDSNPTLISCMFIGNSARTGAGGIAGGSGILTNCTFIGNSSKYGGAVYNGEDCPMFTGCAFINNTATEEGGAMHIDASNPTVTSCIFTGNKANCGGGIYSRSYSRPTLSNCTFGGNAAQNGNAVACDSYQQKYPSNLSLTNCILWEAGNEIWNNDHSVITITYSDVQGGWPGKGNIDADPCFLEQGYWANANDPNIIMEPGDPNAVWIDGDYRLLPGSPCINAGDPDYVAEPNETDLDGEPRIIGRRVDMGAYEYSGPLSAEFRFIPHTINLASKGKWIICSICLPEQYSVADIEPNSVLLEFLGKQIKADPFFGGEERQIATAKFNRDDVQAILELGDIELTITGQLTDGTVFEAADTIKVINKAGKE
jgi:predicted outer membrane repeat protein